MSRVVPKLVKSLNITVCIKKNLDSGKTVEIQDILVDVEKLLPIATVSVSLKLLSLKNK